MIVAAADGSSLNNPGPAGWAWYIDDDTCCLLYTSDAADE